MVCCGFIPSDCRHVNTFGSISGCLWSCHALSGSNPGGQWTLGGFKPANNELGSSVRQSAQDPMNTHSFFFSFDSVLPGEASKPASGGLPSWGRPSLKKTLAVPVFIVQNDRAWS